MSFYIKAKIHTAKEALHVARVVDAAIELVRHALVVDPDLTPRTCRSAPRPRPRKGPSEEAWTHA